MGIKISLFTTKSNNLKLFLILVLLLTNVLQAQTSNVGDNMKKYVFDHCLYINYNKIDSSFLTKFQMKDMSSTEFSTLGKLTDSQTKKLRNYTIKEAGNFYSMGHIYYSEQENSNIIVAKCLYFYESKELDSYIRKLIGVTSQRKNSKK
ncbi:hypothetical protein C1637_06200 [Chryseobacterium lactis]|uniref:Uncharacterized protein n=2 Tax=Chryseobacterium lactis TaxID=1241981 RepID=A0A3G6RNN0_CHRLC|nr:hypothetical protein [Chryseobacterium lactis]AZA84431.1 hypothetical protein EG342_22170 [Chryseobacterium lactis]AZB04819.1 hypothetical protein EG341_13050 [Chryseobacterium lactis]PNW14550.1 hypothetical protein C1637_06200 [Chryseobacterium lactis]